MIPLVLLVLTMFFECMIVLTRAIVRQKKLIQKTWPFASGKAKTISLFIIFENLPNVIVNHVHQQ